MEGSLFWSSGSRAAAAGGGERAGALWFNGPPETSGYTLFPFQPNLPRNGTNGGAGRRSRRRTDEPAGNLSPYGGNRGNHRRLTDDRARSSTIVREDCRMRQGSAIAIGAAMYVDRRRSFQPYREIKRRRNASRRNESDAQSYWEHLRALVAIAFRLQSIFFPAKLVVVATTHR